MLQQTAAPAALHAGEVLRAPHEAAPSLYVHIPFCSHKCHYCDFYSFVDTQDRQAEFTDRLVGELSALAPHAAPLETVFVGGGTPSLLRVGLWERLLSALRGSFDLSPIDAGRGEFTVECNPETVSAELVRTLRAGGVTRVSVGAQSFHPDRLRTLERRHDPANVERALRLAEDAGIRRRSVDLIFGVPGQTLDDWRADLERALALPVEHVSAYALTYEPNTAMTARLARGEFAPCGEDLEADMYEWTVARLRDAGMERYEVSNFAAPGAESLHNLAYWRQRSWLAAGPSASGHVREPDPALGGRRWKNVPRLTDWMEGVASNGGRSPATDVEWPDRRRALRERLMMGVRLREGLALADVERDADAVGCGERLRTAVAAEAEHGLLAVTGGALRLTDRGFLLADGVARRLLRAVGDGAGAAG